MSQVTQVTQYRFPDLLMLDCSNTIVENKFQNSIFCSYNIAIVASQSIISYDKILKSTNFKTYFMHQNNVLFARNENLLNEIYSIICFRCIVKIVNQHRYFRFSLRD